MIVLWIKEFSDVKFADYIVNIIRVGLIYIFIQLSISNAALECQWHSKHFGCLVTIKSANLCTSIREHLIVGNYSLLLHHSVCENLLLETRYLKNQQWFSISKDIKKNITAKISLTFFCVTSFCYLGFEGQEKIPPLSWMTLNIWHKVYPFSLQTYIVQKSTNIASLLYTAILKSIFFGIAAVIEHYISFFVLSVT